MKKTIFSLVIGVMLVNLGFAQKNEMVLEGTYQGKNIYVQNPFASSGVGFCVVDVKVNGQQSIDEINSSAFEIDFASYSLKKGQPVVVKIEFKDDCSPRVINPEVLRAMSTYVITAVNIDKNGLLTWSTTGESGSLPYIIEQYRWNKWVKVGEVKGKGSDGENKYSFRTKPHSGPNQFRIKQIDFSKKPNISRDIKLRRSNTEPVVIANPDKSKVVGSLIFKTESGLDVETMYEIYNNFGNLVKKGYGKTVDVSALQKGTYWINFDNKTEQFTKEL